MQLICYKGSQNLLHLPSATIPCSFGLSSRSTALSTHSHWVDHEFPDILLSWECEKTLPQLNREHYLDFLGAYLASWKFWKQSLSSRKLQSLEENMKYIVQIHYIKTVGILIAKYFYQWHTEINLWLLLHRYVTDISLFFCLQISGKMCCVLLVIDKYIHLKDKWYIIVKYYIAKFYANNLR